MNQSNQEWTTLQYQFDAYEKFSLIIKLVSVIILALAVMASVELTVIALINFILWTQDAIWKTFQGRIFERLLVIEQALTAQQSLPIAFNLSWQSKRPNSLGLIKEYMSSALKPTVLFPHAIIVSVALWLSLT